MNLIKLNIKTENQKYSIFIGNNILNKIDKILKKNLINFNQCLIVVDKNLPKKIINKILISLPKKKYFFTIFILVKEIKTKRVLIKFCQSC